MADPNQPTSPDDRDETASERADRNFAEQVQELRVAQTGVQILFAFLLSLAFYAEFPVDDPQFDFVLVTALLCSAGATICFITPVASHRLMFRQGRKEGVVWVAQTTATVGLVLLLAAMALAVWLVTAKLWTKEQATWFAVLLVVAGALMWLALPLWVRSRSTGARDGNS